MRTSNALGFGLFLVVLALLMPAVFRELARTFVVFLQSSEDALGAAGALASKAARISQ